MRVVASRGRGDSLMIKIVRGCRGDRGIRTRRSCARRTDRGNARRRSRRGCGTNAFRRHYGRGRLRSRAGVRPSKRVATIRIGCQAIGLPRRRRTVSRCQQSVSIRRCG